MIPVKIIQTYQKSIENLNKSIEKEIDTFEIDYDKMVQNFVCFLGDIHCNVNIVKHFNKYVYDIKLFDYKSAELVYVAAFIIGFIAAAIKQEKISQANIEIETKEYIFYSYKETISINPETRCITFYNIIKDYKMEHCGEFTVKYLK